MSEFEKILDRVNTSSRPSQLKITDLRITVLEPCPYRCVLVKIYTNQGIVGYGESRDISSPTYAAMLKSRILGENPCNVDQLFRRIKQFGAHGRQAGGVCAIEIALWDLAGKAYGVPVYQMLGGKFRDRARVYCDNEVKGKNTGEAMGKALKERLDLGYTFLKMDLGLGILRGIPGTVSAPLGYFEETSKLPFAAFTAPTEENRELINKGYREVSKYNSLKCIHLTEKGLDILEEYVAQVRSIIGYEVPLAVDHIGPLGAEDAIRLARRLEKFNLAWLEDPVPWQLTEDYKLITRSTTTPIATGEDIYLKESFMPLITQRAVSVIHPDILASGGIMENKKIGDIAQDYGIPMAIHMAASPVACMATVHSAAATENFLAMEFHSQEVPWWNDLAEGVPKPIVNKGYITVPEGPGLGIELNDEVIAEHINDYFPGHWEPTEQWNREWSWDRNWN